MCNSNGMFGMSDGLGPAGQEEEKKELLRQNLLRQVRAWETRGKKWAKAMVRSVALGFGAFVTQTLANNDTMTKYCALVIGIALVVFMVSWLFCHRADKKRGEYLRLFMEEVANR